MIYVDGGRCEGCGICVDTCPTGAMRLVEDVAFIEQSLCSECQACLEACPQGAILSVSEPAAETVQTPERVDITQPVVPVETRLPATHHPSWESWLGTALDFVGTEVAPRVVASLLDAWDRRASHPSSRAPTGQDVIHPAGMSAPTPVARGGGHRRRRRRGGR